MPLTDDLKAEYIELFRTCKPSLNHISETNQAISAIALNQDRYKGLGAKIGIPWPFIAVVHMMEAGQRFDRHIHNGDPLTARTVRVPSGRPLMDDPPYTWEESAHDALCIVKKLDRWGNWSLEGTLYQLEAYNGFGYRTRKTGIRSPYLWSFSNHYTAGKFVKDGIFDPGAISKQIGAATLLRLMHDRMIIQLG